MSGARGPPARGRETSRDARQSSRTRAGGVTREPDRHRVAHCPSGVPAYHAISALNPGEATSRRMRTVPDVPAVSPLFANTR